MLGPAEPSAALAAWGSAWLGGDIDLDEACRRVAGQTPGAGHAVTGVPGDEPGQAAELAWALAALEARGTRRLRLVLPEPGHLAGVPGPRGFVEAALSAGQAVVAVGAPLALVPVIGAHGSELVEVTWEVRGVSDLPQPWVPAPLGEAELALAEALRAATAELVALDVARTAPDLAADLSALRDQRPGPALPLGYPARASALADRARRLLAICGLAETDAGNTTNRLEAQGRAGALRGLATAARAALVCAHDAYRPERVPQDLGVPGARRPGHSVADRP